MSEHPSTPPYQIADNPHALIHCGPVAPEVIDDKRDLTIATSGGCYTVWAKNGNKVDQIQGASHETCGYNADQQKEDAIAKSITAIDGDIHLSADMGNIILKGKNIYFEATGEGDNGCIIALANGKFTMVSNDEMKLASGTCCITGKKSIDMRGQVKVIGGLTVNADDGFISLATNFSWASVVKMIAQSCK